MSLPSGSRGRPLQLIRLVLSHQMARVQDQNTKQTARPAELKGLHCPLKSKKQQVRLSLFITYFLSSAENFNTSFHSNLTEIPEESGGNPILQKGNMEPTKQKESNQGHGALWYSQLGWFQI